MPPPSTRPIGFRSSSGYDELVALTDSPIARLNRAVAVGEADGLSAGLAALGELDEGLPRYWAVAAHLYEATGDILAVAADLYVTAADKTDSTAERNHLILPLREHASALPTEVRRRR